MDEMRFDGRVAIVTGAGAEGGLGREYARLLAARGAAVVVNDIGVAPDGRGSRTNAAEEAAQELVEKGYRAVPDMHSVVDGAEAIVETAVREFGGVDIVVNNAGVSMFATFDEISDDDIRLVLDVDLMGPIWMCRAAWPHMSRAGYGRIVNISSDAAMGRSKLSIYGAAKGGLLSLTYGLAIEGAPKNILANAVGPGAGTRALTHWYGDSDWQQRYVNDHRPDLVAPAVVALAHEDCPLTGQFVRAIGTRVAARFFSETEGREAPDDHTVESVHAAWDAIGNRSNVNETGISNRSIADLAEADSDHASAAAAAQGANPQLRPYQA